MIGTLIGIVDDDPSMRQAMSWALRAIGLRTAIYESADAFLDTGVTDELGCLILDLRMPGMGGLELLRRLVPRPGTPPIIVVSADVNRATAARALSQGALTFLQKPFSPDALVDAVVRALSLTAATQARSR